MRRPRPGVRTRPPTSRPGVVRTGAVTAEAARRARALLAQGRVADALRVTAPLAAEPDATAAVLSAHAAGLQAKGDREQALRFHERAALASPGSAVAQHNIAAVLGDLRRFDESREAAGRRGRAFFLGSRRAGGRVHGPAGPRCGC